jgi:multiple sugar transport system ATP-binding protein
MARVELNRVCKSYDKTDVLRDISLSVADREFVVLVGPSGCGKSTVLRIIAGLESLTSGEIQIGDRVVNDVPAKDRDIAMVFQNYALYPHMSVYDNMAFGLKMRKFPKAEIDTRVRDAAKILDLAHLLDRKPKQLSGGQRQRVALGRAIVRDPKVFLMDEPLSNLDAKLRVQMRSEIAKLHQRLNATTVYVTHDQVEAMTMGDRIVILNKGVIQQVDKPMNIYNTPANLFVAGFIGQMNLLKGMVTGRQLVLAEGAALTLPDHLAAVAQAYEGKALTLGLRPEHFAVPECIVGEGPPENTLSVTPDHIEALGSELMIHFPLGADRVVAKLPPDRTASVGQPLNLLFKLEPAHLFHPETEARLA